MTEHKDLLYYVDRLRAPYRDAVVQENDQRVRCVSHTERDGLLKQLRDAVYSGIGRRGAGTLGSFRLPFDAGALALYERLEAEIGGAFYELTGQPVYLELERTLKAWYDAHTDAVRRGRLTLADDDDALARARGWVQAIEGLFDPPRVIHLVVPRGTGSTPAPCVVCRERFAADLDTGDRVYALRVEVRGERLQASCRACGTEWDGEASIRELVAEIDEVDRALLEAEAVAS